jgi:tRNA (Thr-GGU) A37 N-methylase
METMRRNPFLDSAECSVFATRLPARPNLLRISSVCLLGLEGSRLKVADVHLLGDSLLHQFKPSYRYSITFLPSEIAARRETYSPVVK